jgi:hypothetical protein
MPKVTCYKQPRLPEFLHLILGVKAFTGCSGAELLTQPGQLRAKLAGTYYDLGIARRAKLDKRLILSKLRTYSARW